MATATSTMKQQEENPKNKTQEMGEKAKDKASEVYEKAKDFAGNAADKAREVGSNVYDKAKETASNFGKSADDATSAVGRGMESLAGTMRQNMPQGGMIGGAAEGLASRLENTGQYIEEHGLGGIAEDVMKMIRRNPLPAVLVGVGLGFILARALSSRD